MPELDWAGIIAIEGEPTGDGRMLEVGSLNWETGPWPVIWDREEGDHTAMVVGSMARIWRDSNGDGPTLIRAEGAWSDSDDPETIAAVGRVTELLEEGAVGVSIAFDAQTIEVRGDPDLIAESGLVASLTHDPDATIDDITVILASLGGDPNLALAEVSRPWSPVAARNRVIEHCTHDGELNPFQMRRAFLWQDGDYDDPDSYALLICDVVNGSLRIVPKAVVAAAVGSRSVGTLNLSEDDRAAVEARLCRVYERIAETYENWSDCPFTVSQKTIARIAHDDILSVVTSARVRHLAIVDTPAFADARIGLVASLPAPHAPMPPTGRDEEEGAVTASLNLAAPFSNPEFGRDGYADARLVRQDPERPGEAVVWGSPLRVIEDGSVYGHAALWGRCHAGFRNRCVIPPRGGDYSRFLHGEATPGVPTGPLTVGTTHATLEMSATAAMDHYSHTGRAVADVIVGEDNHGLWVSGRLRPGVSDRDLADLRGSSLSGDWRPVNGRYRLVGLLAVNQPGYLVQRASATGAVITAGPCACDADEEATLAERVLALEMWREQVLVEAERQTV